jgi:hypothetical protein
LRAHLRRRSRENRRSQSPFIHELFQTLFWIGSVTKGGVHQFRMPHQRRHLFTGIIPHFFILVYFGSFVFIVLFVSSREHPVLIHLPCTLI